MEFSVKYSYNNETYNGKRFDLSGKALYKNQIIIIIIYYYIGQLCFHFIPSSDSFKLIPLNSISHKRNMDIGLAFYNFYGMSA